MPAVDRKIPVRDRSGKDEAFCFIYEDNLELLKELGAELIEFSPIHDTRLPEGLDGLLLYGGLSGAVWKRAGRKPGYAQADKREALDKGLPVMAECGGFMYLHQYFQDMEGNDREGIGAIEGKAYKTPRLSRFGYLTLEKKEGECFRKEDRVLSCP